MQIELACDIPSRLRKALFTAGPREIGGVLLAEQLEPGHFRVIDFSLDARSGSHTQFRRDPDVHKKTIDDFFERTGHDFSRFNYLGEWHSHPSFSVQPRQQDIETMVELVEHNRSEIYFAILLIVRLRFRTWLDYSMTTFVRGHLPLDVVYGEGRNPTLLGSQ